MQPCIASVFLNKIDNKATRPKPVATTMGVMTYIFVKPMDLLQHLWYPSTMIVAKFQPTVNALELKIHL
jgi:hypothetical protein